MPWRRAPPRSLTSPRGRPPPPDAQPSSLRSAPHPRVVAAHPQPSAPRPRSSLPVSFGVSASSRRCNSPAVVSGVFVWVPAPVSRDAPWTPACRSKRESRDRHFSREDVGTSVPPVHRRGLIRGISTARDAPIPTRSKPSNAPRARWVSPRPHDMGQPSVEPSEDLAQLSEPILLFPPCCL